MELWLLPRFALGGTPSWSELSDFVVVKTKDQWAKGYIEEKEFDQVINQYFEGITIKRELGTGLSYEAGKYKFSGGFSYHGSMIFELVSFEKRTTLEGRDIWKAKLHGYYFGESDGISEDDQSQTQNAKVVWQEMKKPENKGLEFWQVKERMIGNEPGSKLELNATYTLEFLVNNPTEEIHFTYLSCEKEWFD